MKDPASDEALSEYEAKRRQRMEENQRMLASLNIPTVSRPSVRPQPVKSAVKLEPTRRSTRQEKLRALAEKQEKERQIVQQQEIERQAAQKLELDLKKMELARKKELEAAEIELQKQQQKLKRKQQQELKKEEKRQKLEQVRHRKEQEIKRQQKFEATQRRQRKLMERQQQMKKQQQQWQRQQELPPEKIAQRNAEIQKFIQEELDKQAKLAKEKLQREQEWRDAAKVQVQVPTTDVVADGSKTGTTDPVATAGLEAFMGEIEYELVL